MRSPERGVTSVKRNQREPHELAVIFGKDGEMAAERFS
jgi:hypothetical protein